MQEPTEGYNEHKYFAWVLNGVNCADNSPTTTAVMPSVAIDDKKFGTVGANWMFLTVNQYNRQREEYELAMENSKAALSIYKKKQELYDIINNLLQMSENKSATKKKVISHLKKILKQSKRK